MRKEILDALKELKTICLKKKEDSKGLNKELFRNRRAGWFKNHFKID